LKDWIVPQLHGFQTLRPHSPEGSFFVQADYFRDCPTLSNNRQGFGPPSSNPLIELAAILRRTP